MNSLIFILSALALLNILCLLLSFMLYLLTRKLISNIKTAARIEDNIKSTVEEHIEAVARTHIAKIISRYGKTLEKQGLDSQNRLSSTVDKIILDLSAFIKTQEQSFISQNQKQIQLTSAEANRQVEEYKNSRLKLVDDQIKKVVEKTSRDILGKTLSLEDHEQLIKNALEQAKKEGVFV